LVDLVDKVEQQLAPAPVPQAPSPVAAPRPSVASPRRPVAPLSRRQFAGLGALGALVLAGGAGVVALLRSGVGTFPAPGVATSTNTSASTAAKPAGPATTAGVTPAGGASAATGAGAAISVPIFPPDNIWNRRVARLPVHPRSAAYLASIGLNEHLQADFGSGLWEGAPIGIPYAVVTGEQPEVPIEYTAYGDESDPGPFPIPPNAPIEGGPQSKSDTDRHVIVVDTGRKMLYELYRAFPNADGSWRADSGARWSLTSNALRPDGWTSADGAGLPIFPGLARYDEVARGMIPHALRFTVPRTQRAHIWPARHHASSRTDQNLPPMGLRLRLKQSVDISGYPDQARVVLQCLKDYGMMLSDNGSAIFVTGAPDERWDNDQLAKLREIRGADFEVVDTSGLMIHLDSGAAVAE
jgi:hypothetical protein